ncbi:hypothetical protein [Sediminibacterium ginsengisoli]|uniref:Uncharacterized protein n=1 Tax=Sediminibacterium ginsengisoli TaxID=413434 RepID=A0A1T4NH46_9BACT|nr:hypothetical protein [Sediminibacterium ginsengisoli]SJZ78579.1 hypothetical protein SAMN04488132_104256 [Sediminibacterium ginsengisoli]
MKHSFGQIFKWQGWVVVVYVIAAIISREVYDKFFPGENIFSIPRLIATFIPALIAGVIFSRWFKKKAGVEEEG